jgi:ribonuclease BN (tRNA processing enzyme)
MTGVRIDLIGTGDAVGSGGRHHTCIAVTSTSACVLIDCGGSAIVAMRQQGFDPSRVDTILLTHLHGDHFGGIPFFLIDARYIHRRTRRLVIAGPPGVEQRVRATAESMYPNIFTGGLPFELTFVEIRAGEPQTIGPVEVTAFDVVHSSGAPPYALRLHQDGRVVTFSGDTAWTESLVDAARGADLFICECNAFDNTNAMHLTYSMILTHLGEQMLSRIGELEFEIASDGQRIEL